MMQRQVKKMSIFKKKTTSKFKPASTPEKRIKQKYAIWGYYKQKEERQVKNNKKKTTKQFTIYQVVKNH